MICRTNKLYSYETDSLNIENIVPYYSLSRFDGVSDFKYRVTQLCHYMTCGNIRLD